MESNRELRIALAMRGGVSLAVWIGGAVAEIDVLRRAGVQLKACQGIVPDPRDDPESGDGNWDRRRIYMQLLADAGYGGGVSVDVLAGASAGGLNAVIYGYAQSVGLDMEWLLDVWKTEGSIWKLLQQTRFGASRRTWWTGRLTSVLQGDDVFYPTVFRQLAEDRRLTWLPPPDPSAYRTGRKYAVRDLSIDLSATLLDSVHGSQPTLGGRPLDVTIDQANAVGFHFRRRPARIRSPFTDLPGPADVLGPVTGSDGDQPVVRNRLARLALAARSTSSFPGAFEPARLRIDHEEPDFPPQDESGSGAVPTPSMRGVFSAVGQPGQVFRVVDGGVYDNIPISRALLAIQTSPATGPTARSLIYLDPSPPLAGSLPVEEIATTSGWLADVAKAVGLRQRQENAEDEVELIRLHNENEAKTRGRQLVLAGLLSKVGDAGPAVPSWLRWLLGGELEGLPELRERYCRWRASLDAERYGLLFTQPSTILMRTWIDHTNPERLTQDAAVRLVGLLDDVYAGLATSSGCDCGTDCGCGCNCGCESLREDGVSLLGIVTLLVSWARALENTPSRDEASKLKKPLYRLRDLALAIRGQSEARLVDGFVRPEGAAWGELRELVCAGLAWQHGLRVAGSPTLTELLETRSEEDYWDWVEQALVRAPDQVGGEPLLREMWKVAASYRDRLVGLNPRSDRNDATAQWKVQWDSSIFRQLSRSAFSHAELTYVNALLAVSGGTTGTASTVDFGRITADQKTWMPPELIKEIEVDELSRRTRRLLRGHAGEETLALQLRALTRLDKFSAESKLAGNQLANFAGFADAGWRTHDWTWGRADAAAGIVELLGRQRDAELKGQADELHGHSRELQQSVWAGQEFDRAKPTVQDLSPAYRFALVSRIVQLVYRGIWPTGWSWTSVLRRLLLLLVRPVLMLAPLVARPSAAVATLALVVLAGLPQRVAHLAARSEPDLDAGFAHWWLLAMFAVLLLGGVVTVIRLAAGMLRWNALIQAYAPAGGDDVSLRIVLDADAALVRRWRLKRGMLIGSGSALVILAVTVAAGWCLLALLRHRTGEPVHAVWSGLLPTAVLTGVVLLGEQVALSVTRSTPRAAGAPKNRRERGLLALAVVVLVVACLAPTVDHLARAGAVEKFDAGWRQVALVAVIAFVIALIVHHGWATRAWGPGAAVLIGGLTALLDVGLENLGRSGHAWNGSGVVTLGVAVGVALSTALVNAREDAPGGPSPGPIRA